MRVIQLSRLSFNPAPTMHLRDFPLFYEESGEREDRKFWARVARRRK